jgi:hypothetical protein
MDCRKNSKGEIYNKNAYDKRRKTPHRQPNVTPQGSRMTRTSYTTNVIKGEEIIKVRA